MANVQKQFTEFYSAIKLLRFEENATLQTSRDDILEALSKGLKRDFEARG